MPYMLKIRLQRIGRKNEAAFRLVVTDSKNGPQSGKFLEILGSYTLKNDVVVIKKERVSHWMANGAQVSDTAYNMLVKQGVIEGRAKNVLSRKAPTVARKEIKKKK
jgi:small subunit ribosomal protein S16